jgi:hypothetical protein
MFLKITLLSLLFFVSCTKEEKTDNTGLVLALVQTQNLNSANASLNAERNSQFILNGSWNSFTGNATTGASIVTVNAKQGSNGVFLTDGTGFSSCAIINQFDNNSGFYIAQNPENNGGCFSGDTNRGRYFKTIFFQDGARYWTCTIFSAQTTLAAALAVVDNTTRTSPGTTGCGGFAWSRLERR